MEPIWKAAAGVLSTVAPMLATAVGGPLAGAATNAIIGALGLPQDTPPEQVAAAVQSATPEQLLALKRAEQEFAVKMRELDVTLEQLRFSDTANARAREIAVRDWMPRALGLMVVAAAISAVLIGQRRAAGPGLLLRLQRRLRGQGRHAATGGQAVKLTLHRRPSADGVTLGNLTIDGKHECFTCEDVVRPDGEKVPGKTAIPAGVYRIILNQSVRFKRRLPLLLDVPMFTGIRIHSGNTQHDTEGCILPGRGFLPDRVTQSVIAFEALFAKLERAEAAREDIWIEIRPALVKQPIR
jgi:hypothetical protein